MAHLTITLAQLFRSEEGSLDKAMRMLDNGAPVSQVAQNVIMPILCTLCQNAGQEMDATFVTYMLQAALKAVEDINPFPLPPAPPANPFAN
jgi:hypothetical protein